VIDRVLVLPDDLANQIAAGEVVERPASVVKELVENALDADATRIIVEIEEGGRKRIRVTDNGYGMSPGDSERCLLRHATSKLRSTADLFTIRTLGFRGEAIPSIASVSKFALRTRTEGSLEGSELTVVGGIREDFRAWGGPSGTVVEVSDLFFNTPARFKFLKTTPTETRHISEWLLRLAISRFDVHFRLFHNGKRLFDLPVDTGLGDRLRAVLGREVRAGLFPTAPFPPVEGVVCTGFYSRPDLTQRTARGYYTFVNRRYVKERTIQAAVRAAYRGMIEKGRHPTVVLFLDVPVDGLDVNVHPTKIDVRFKSTDSVFRAVYHAVGDALQHTPWVEDASRTYTLRTRGDVQNAAHSGSIEPLDARQAPLPMGEHRRPAEPPRVALEHLFGARPSGQPEGAAPTSAPQLRNDSSTVAGGGWGDLVAAAQESGATGLTPGAAQEVGGPAARIAIEISDGYFSRLRYMGQFRKAYLVCADASGIVIVDQHAAHERITFEHLRAVYRDEHKQAQALLIPQRISLDALRAATMREHGLGFFGSLGFEIEPFGGDDFALAAVPAVLSRKRFDRLIQDTLDELADYGRSDRIQEARDAVLIRMACHGSIRAGDDMTPEAVQELFRQLDAVDFGANCPHGRPVYFRVPLLELETAFGR
jgi:DNA mismatch repair protein MutL